MVLPGDGEARRCRSCPPELKKGLDIVYVDNFVDVLPHALLGRCRSEEEGSQT